MLEQPVANQMEDLSDSFETSVNPPVHSAKGESQARQSDYRQRVVSLKKVAKTVSRNKVTGCVQGQFPIHTLEELKQSIQKAKTAQKQWAKLSVDERGACLLKIVEYLTENVDELTSVISQDNGKTRTDALITEILPSAAALTYYIKKAKSYLKAKTPFPASVALINKWSRIVRVPYGVIGIISPWNYPFAIPFSEVVMGILAGNAVVLKTASETQLIGLALKKSMDAAGLPDGIFTHINMPGKLAGDAFLESGVDKLFFTGSVPVGKQLMKKASETLTPVSLELGGNDAMLVCESADPVRAASGAVWAGFQNAGQSCGGVERIYVHENIYDAFMQQLKQKVQALRVGHDTDYNVDIGSMTTSRQKETVLAHIDDALQKGATIFAQSDPNLDPDLKNCLPATVLIGVTHDMRVMQEETFGPVVGVMKVVDMEEAVRLANDSDLGLTSSVWTRDKKQALDLSQKIEAGVVNINDHLMSHGMPETPWGGFKNSSIGRSHGEIGFEEMTQPKVIVNDILPLKNNLWWYPFDKQRYDGLKGLMKVLFAKNWKTRIKGALDLAKVVPRIFMA